jgi:two-component system chemotaxis sensor kinase CheA
VELLRSLHTLKGLAGMMGVEPIVELAHAMESLVRVAQHGRGVLPAAALDPLVAATQAISGGLRAMADGVPVPAAPDSVLLALEQIAAAPWPGTEDASPPVVLPVLDAVLAGKLARSELEELQQAFERGERVSQIVFAPSPAKAEAGATITTVRAAVGRLGRIVRVLPRSVPRSDAAPGGLEFVLLVVTQSPPQAIAAAAGLAAVEVTPLARRESAAPSPADDDAFARASRKGVVRMDVAKLDTALEHLSSLGIGQLHLREEARTLASAGVDVRPLLRRLDDQERQLRRMRGTLLELRMVPLREVLEPLPLIVRGLRNTTGKHVRLAVEVGDAELDKTVAERLFPALVHLVRNAIDHGIEDVDARRARGKPEEGLLRVEAASASTMLEISMSDDGGGVDLERVAQRAGRPVPQTDVELLEILTVPGFSTRDTATTTSGRGLGLDIVRQTVEALGGTLELENRPGQGTTLRVRAPLTVAILDAFAFVAGRERYLAPIAVVDAIVEVDPAQVVRPPGRDGGARAPSLLHARGAIMPLLSLRGALGLPRAGDETRAMIVRRHGQPFAFGIERMLGRHEVLVRPLVDPLVAVWGVAGSADLGDGRPTLVLDLPALTTRLARGAAGEARV